SQQAVALLLATQDGITHVPDLTHDPEFVHPEVSAVITEAEVLANVRPRNSSRKAVQETERVGRRALRENDIALVHSLPAEEVALQSLSTTKDMKDMFELADAIIAEALVETEDLVGAVEGWWEPTAECLSAEILARGLETPAERESRAEYAAVSEMETHLRPDPDASAAVLKAAGSPHRKTPSDVIFRASHDNSAVTEAMPQHIGLANSGSETFAEFESRGVLTNAEMEAHVALALFDAGEGEAAVVADEARMLEYYWITQSDGPMPGDAAGTKPRAVAAPVAYSAQRMTLSEEEVAALD
ncbi:hypothetical protein HK405_001697, partial [Cladochytrium tenue]